MINFSILCIAINCEYMFYENSKCIVNDNLIIIFIQLIS